MAYLPDRETEYITPSERIRFVSGFQNQCPECAAMYHPSHAMSDNIEKACPRCYADPEKIREMEAAR